jgi:hypothetical protein
VTDDELRLHRYRPAEPPWWPGDESGYEEYHRRLFTLTARSTGFTRWKVLSTGINIARQLAGARNAGRAAWTARHGKEPAGWLLQHPPAVLWIPEVAYAACLRCWWLGGSNSERADAADAAKRHTALFLAVGDPALVVLLEPVAMWTHPAPGQQVVVRGGRHGTDQTG